MQRQTPEAIRAMLVQDKLIACALAAAAIGQSLDALRLRRELSFARDELFRAAQAAPRTDAIQWGPKWKAEEPPHGAENSLRPLRTIMFGSDLVECHREDGRLLVRITADAIELGEEYQPDETTMEYWRLQQKRLQNQRPPAIAG